MAGDDPEPRLSTRRWCWWSSASLASLVPGVPEYQLDPEVVLIGLLPPLLYAAAIRTSLVDFRANRRAIGAAVGRRGRRSRPSVVGLVAWRLLPEVSARRRASRSAPSWRRRTRWPPRRSPAGWACRGGWCPSSRARACSTTRRRWSSLRTAIAAITARVGVWAVVGDFVLAVGRRRRGRLRGRRWCSPPSARRVDGPGARHDAVVHRAVPGLPAGRGHPRERRARRRRHRADPRPQGAGAAVGVVAAVRADQLAHRAVRAGERRVPAHRPAGAATSIRARATATGRPRPRRAALRRGAPGATIVARIVWVFGATAIYRSGRHGCAAHAWPWAHAALVSWAGMRGVVTLAAAFALPEATPAARRAACWPRSPSWRHAAAPGHDAALAGPPAATCPARTRPRTRCRRPPLLSNATRAGLDRLEELRSDGRRPER